MAPLESLDVVRDMLRALSERPEPLVKELPPSPGSRAERYAQLLSPDLHPEPVPGTPSAAAGAGGAPAAPAPTAGPSLAGRVEVLEAEVVALKDALRRLAASIGEADPLAAIDS